MRGSGVRLPVETMPVHGDHRSVGAPVILVVSSKLGSCEVLSTAPVHSGPSMGYHHHFHPSRGSWYPSPCPFWAPASSSYYLPSLQASVRCWVWSRSRS